jgi:hypothetical protein
VRTGAGWRARGVVEVAPEAIALAAALEGRDDPHQGSKAPIITSRPRAPRMTHSLVHATGRAFRRAEGVEGDLEAICLSGGEGP